MELKFVFFDWNEGIVFEYKKALKDYEDKYSIKYDTGDIRKILEKHKCTCIVSPANSFGEMNGGIDYYISKMFPDVEKNVKQTIKEQSYFKTYSGIPVLPVGNTMLSKTGNEKCPNIFVMPTMFKPCVIKGTDNVYKAFLSLLDEFHNKQFIVGVPGLGTGVGDISAKECAKQVALAFKHFREKRELLDI
jgi:O-acetyl-ADP-ribose deacetylase (regulator of RNase III)